MPALTHLRGKAAAMLAADINTDAIAPFNRPSQAGKPRNPEPSQLDLARGLFSTQRFDAADNELDHILNRAPFRTARFLLAGPNFACGSSRESAPRMLAAFGIQCVVAPSFGQIFFDNCFRNAILPLILPFEQVQALAAQAETGGEFALDVAAGTLVAPDGGVVRFTLPAFRRDMLLTGADQIALTLQTHTAAIDAWQQTQRAERPWAFPPRGQ